MIKSFLAACSLAVMLVFTSFNVSAFGYDNLLANPNFSQGMPTDWYPQSFRENNGQKFLWFRAMRVLAVKIPKDRPNDAFWKQEVDVHPNTDYILSGWIRTWKVTETIDTENVGANLSILESLPEKGSFTHTKPLLGNNRWKFRYVQFNTGELNQITVALRLGMFSGQTTGIAWFKGVRLQKLEY